MLLNASHELTNCGLPQHIQERYVRYKQGNRAIAAWMTRYGPEKFRGRKTLPIKQLIALGELLCDQIHDIGALPSDVDYYFNEVIKERTYLSQHFRSHRDQCEKDMTDTVNHEHFTESLKQIHQTLSTAGKQPSRKNVKISTQQAASSRFPMSENKNNFNYLLSDDVSTQCLSDPFDDDNLSTADTDATSECSHSPLDDHKCACESDDEATDFLDTEGQMGVAMESLMFLGNVQDLVKAVKLCWFKAGRGDAPVAATAAYTDVLLARATTHVRVFHQNEPELRTALDIKQCLGSLSWDYHHSGQARRSLSETLEAVTQIHALVTQPDRKPPDRSSSNEIFDTSNNPEFDVAARQTTLSLIKQLVLDFVVAKNDQQPSSLTSNGLSCIEEVRRLLAGNHDSTTVLTASILLYLLSIAHCAYSSVLSQPSHIALPRISALKMANEALSSIRAFIDDERIFPCQCTNTLGFRVMQMKFDLESFSKYRCWSALMQSPLISGNHVLEILDVCSYYGMHLFHYRHYVAAVLHSYHALVQLQVLDVVPILEEACMLFAPVLYTTGIQPESGFTASWLRYIGARLKFKKGQKYQNHKDTWCMSVPVHAAARSAGLNIDGKNDETRILPKFDYGTFDHIIRMKRESWVLYRDAAEVLDRELCASSSINTSHTSSSQTLITQPQASPHKTRRTRHKRSKSCQVDNGAADATYADCLKLDHAFNASFTVDESEGRNLPSSRINLLSFFHSMTKVVSGISDVTHTNDDKNDSSPSKDSGKGQMCLCFVQTILRGADRVLDVRKRDGIDAKGAVWSKNEKVCIECYKQHLKKMLEDAKVLDGSGGTWLWSSI